MTDLRAPRGRIAAHLAGYMLLRFALLLVLAALCYGMAHLIGVQLPPVIALFIAAVASMPLSWLLFGRFNQKVGAEMAELGARRQSERAALRAQLAGDAQSAKGPEQTIPSQE